MEELLKAQDICFSRNDKTLLSKFNLSLHAGQCLQILGPNGVGKTSLLRVLTGVLTPEKGKLFWRNKALPAAREAYYHDLVFVGHGQGIKSDLTVFEQVNIEFSHRASTSQTIQAYLKRLGLIEQQDVFCRNLSAGQKQRLALVRLLLSPAKIWILDEPFAAVDQAGVETIVGLMMAHLQTGGGIIVTTHQRLVLSGITLTQIALTSQDSLHGKKLG